MPLYVHSFTFTPPRRFDEVPDPWVEVRIDEAQDAPTSIPTEESEWTELETIALSPDADPSDPAERHVTTDLATLETGWYRLVVLDSDGDLGVMDAVYDAAGPSNDIRVMIPRVRRAVEGVGSDEVLTDDQMKDLIADALSEVILYTEGQWGHTITATAYEDGVPFEYAVDPVLTLPEQTLVATQAALNHFFHLFQGAAGKISERIEDEAQAWEWSRSAQLLTEQFKLLVGERDKALAAVASADDRVLDGYSSFLAVRDSYTAALVEPWVSGYVTTGQEDYRFGTYG